MPKLVMVNVLGQLEETAWLTCILGGRGTVVLQAPAAKAPSLPFIGASGDSRRTAPWVGCWYPHPLGPRGRGRCCSAAGSCSGRGCSPARHSRHRALGTELE